MRGGGFFLLTLALLRGASSLRREVDAATGSSLEECEFAKILIIGAGPTGLGAATRAYQLLGKGKEGCLLVDMTDRPGGLSRTERTPEGFLFDMGGHVLFSHFQYFDDVIDAAFAKSGDEFYYHQR